MKDQARAKQWQIMAVWFISRMLLIFLGCALALGFLEIGLHVLWHPELTSMQRNVHITVPLDSKVTIGVAGPVHIDTNPEGIRGTEWSSDRSSEYRILAIGGSTTECFAQDQPNTWTALVQTELAQTQDGRSVWVGNAGHGGHGSREHVLAMRYMLDQYNPDAVIIMMGGNEMESLQGPDYDPDFVYNDTKMQGLASSFFESPIPPIKSLAQFTPRNTALWTFFKASRNRIFPANNGDLIQTVEGYRQLQEARQNAWLVVNEMPDLQVGLEGYRNNILEMIRLAREHNTHLVFMTQPTLLKSEMSPEENNRLWAGWFGPRELNAYWSPGVLGKAVDAHNQTLLAVCKEEGIDCIDLASMLPKTIDIFWDQVHFTDYGSSLAADEVIKYFQSYFENTQK
jgi:lysophospholipase L1-like esterase